MSNGAQIEEEHINAGDDFIQELKKDPAFDFDFVSREEAKIIAKKPPLVRNGF